MALDVLRAEFQKSRILYSYNDDRVFFSCHWKIPRPMFVGIQFVLALYTMYALTYYLVFFSLVIETKQNIMVYFTSWSYIVLTAHMVLAALLSIVCYKHVRYERPLKADKARVVGHRNSQQPDHVQMDGLSFVQPSESVVIEKSEPGSFNGDVPEKTVLRTDSNNSSQYESLSGDPISVPKYMKWLFVVSWVLSDIQMCAAPVVTSIYFVAIYPYITYRNHVDLHDLNVHILNSVIMGLDFALSARPVRVLHAWVPVVYGVSWALFSLLYWSADHANNIVYRFIDWSKPATTLAWTTGLAVGLVLLMFIYFGLYRLKVWLYSVIHKEEYYVIINQD